MSIAREVDRPSGPDSLSLTFYVTVTVTVKYHCTTTTKPNTRNRDAQKDAVNHECARLFRRYLGLSPAVGALERWSVSQVCKMYGLHNSASVFNQPLNVWDVSCFMKPLR